MVWWILLALAPPIAVALLGFRPGHRRAPPWLRIASIAWMMLVIALSPWLTSLL